MTNIQYVRKKVEDNAWKIISPFQEFVKAESFGGILLISFTLIALIWANSPWATGYHSLWEIPFSIKIGTFYIDKPLLLWINDGLMAIFFFVVGLEIKRELLVGELSSPRQALFPIAAAIGGMAVPAVIFMLVTRGQPGSHGWGIPMATDIAFALGILSLLGKRAPLSLKIFLTAVAIVDDIGAVLVIALFYTETIVWTTLGLGLILLVILFIMNRLGIRKTWPYAVLGILLWVAFLKSGVHATIAGVLLAMTIPASTMINRKGFLERSRAYLNDFEKEGIRDGSRFTTGKQRAILQSIEDGVELLVAPLQRLENQLHPFVAFLIMPVFALANAGVSFDIDFLNALMQPVTLGIILGLLFGKQIGIFGFTWLITRTGLAKKTAGLSWKQIHGASMLAGIGFTMSLFITNLAFSDPILAQNAKVAIMVSSLFAAVFGYIIIAINGERVIQPLGIDREAVNQ